MAVDQKENIDKEDAVLDYTHAKRMIIVENFMKEGKPPEDPAEVKILLSALDGMDKAALGKKRIKAEDKVANTQAQAAQLIAEMLTKASALNPFQATTPVIRKAPELGPEIPAPTLVDGEISTNAPQQDYDGFLARTSASDVGS